mgnify:CR=1 FL=1
MENTREFIIESRRHGKFIVLIDAEDWGRISQYTWRVCKKNKFYIRTNVPHPEGDRRAGLSRYGHPRGFREYTIEIQRMIMNTPKGMSTDHINGDTLDNRKSNLRICTSAENNRNRGKSSNNKSGYVGVSQAPSGKFIATISHRRKKYHIGTFDTKKKAAMARDKKAKELFGEFAYLNFPEKA